MRAVLGTLLLFLAVTASAPAIAEETVAFYFAAHEDDWQLFMSPSVYRDTQSAATKVVFVYLTAGDGGAGSTTSGKAAPYYLAREHGARLSAMFIANVPAGEVTSTESSVSIAGHVLTRYTYGRTVSYFLRLPDGNMDGDGYAATGLQSLRRLHEGAIAWASSVDGASRYHGWQDLISTLRAVIDRERESATKVWVNIPDIDPDVNPGDHSDHQQSAQAVLSAVRDLDCVGKAFYVDYAAAKLEPNLTATDRDVQAGAFAATAVGLNEAGHAGNWDAQHRQLLGRQYVRTLPGSGRCRS